MRKRLLIPLLALGLPATAFAQSGDASENPQFDPTFPSWEEEAAPTPPPPPPPGSEQLPQSQTPPADTPRAPQTAQPPAPPPAPSQMTVIQNQAEPQPSAPARPTEAEESMDAAANARDERGIVVMGQAGLLTYTGEAAALTRPGTAYGVAVGLDLTRGITAELGYLGASYRTEGDDSVGVTENGAQALVQLGPQQRNFHPFAMFGLQLSRVNALERGDANPNVEDATHLKLPMGAGINYTLPSDADAEITVGARAAYNFTLDAGAFPTLNEPAAANQFTGMAVVGGRF